jgi:fluoroacetyl-CoA thioesterase
MSLEPGLSARVTAVVVHAVTAKALASGDVEGLATSAMIGLMEAAAVKALEGRLTPDMTSVGTRVEVTHAAPTPVGMAVVAQATLVEIEGRLLVFSVSAEDDAGVIGKGTHHRVIVGRAGFAERLDSRWTGGASDTLRGGDDDRARPDLGGDRAGG